MDNQETKFVYAVTPKTFNVYKILFYLNMCLFEMQIVHRCNIFTIIRTK